MSERGQVGDGVVVLERVAQHDALEAMVVAAFDAHHAALNAYAYAALHDDAAAEDAVSETFARLIREARAGRTPDNVAAWLFRVCGNVIVSSRRRQSVARRWMPFLLDRGISRSPEEAIVAHEADEELIRALAVLDRRARVALLLAAQGASMAEIADTIGRSPGATRTLVCRSRLRLREALRPHDEEVDR